MSGDGLAQRLERLLPQTQCGQCGYAGCKPYAAALAAGTAGIDQCPPGGDLGVRRLARVLGRAPMPVDPTRGMVRPLPVVAFIDEERCIGCTLCIQACPVDAIVGAPKLMHTVIAAQCTGCELCLPPCPVDCIVLEARPAEPGLRARQRAARAARRRYQARSARLVRRQQEQEQARRAKRAEIPAFDPVAAALARTRAKAPPPP